MSKKRRAALVLLLLATCALAAGLVAWMRGRSVPSEADLSALVRALGRDPATDARQQLLEAFVQRYQGIPAAVVVDPDDRIQAAYPAPDALVGRKLGPSRAVPPGSDLAGPPPIPSFDHGRVTEHGRAVRQRLRLLLEEVVPAAAGARAVVRPLYGEQREYTGQLVLFVQAS